MQTLLQLIKTAICQQQFGKMAGSVLNWTFGFQMTISAKIKVSASKSATSPSCETLTASAELNAEKTNLTLNCYWISVHYFSPIFWKFPKKLRSIFILQKLEKRTKIQQLLKEKMVVDKTQFGKYRKRSELDAENRNAKKIAEICCAKFWELNVEKNSEEQNLKTFTLRNTENESLCEKKPNWTQKN